MCMYNVHAKGRIMMIPYFDSKGIKYIQWFISGQKVNK